MSTKLFTITVLIFLALAFVMFVFIDSFNSKISEATGLVVNEESFPVYLETHPLIKSLPKSAAIGINFGEVSYEIDGRNVYSGDNLNNDITISLPDGYESVIGELGLCEAIKKASHDNQISIQTYSSKATLLLKYGKLLKYSGCLK